MTKIFAMAITSILITAPAAVAQTGSQPGAAGTNRSGTVTAPTRAGESNGPASRGAGTGENKPSATGGEPGGGTNQQ